MKKLILTLTLFALGAVLVGCIELTTVESIELNWVPQQIYDREDTVTLNDKEITANLEGGGSETVSLATEGVTVSGNGLNVVEGDYFLFTDVVGEYTLEISYEESSVSLSYIVDDEILLALFDGVNNGAGVGEIIADLTTQQVTDFGLDGLNLVFDGSGRNDDDVLLSSPSGDVYYSLLKGYDNSFPNAYVAQQVILSAFAFRTATADGRNYVEELITLYDGGAGTVDTLDFDLLGLNIFGVLLEKEYMTHISNNQGLVNALETYQAIINTFLGGDTYGIKGNYMDFAVQLLTENAGLLEAINNGNPYDGGTFSYLPAPDFEGFVNLENNATLIVEKADATFGSGTPGGYLSIVAMLHDLVFDLVNEA